MIVYGYAEVGLGLIPLQNLVWEIGAIFGWIPSRLMELM